MQLSVVIPSLNEADNLRILLPLLIQTIKGFVDEYEVLIIDGGSKDDTKNVLKDSGGLYIRQSGAGYGDALMTGIRVSRGQYVLTMDADFSHDPSFIRILWQDRYKADILIASRYVKGGSASMPLVREILSRILNVVFGIALSLPIHDLSSGYRLYRASVVKGIKMQSRNFDVLQEILIRAYADGWKIGEVPFHYIPRKHGRSHAKLIRFGISYLKTFGRMWRLRNSIQCGDYDMRAYDSRIPLQRWWQRSRYKTVYLLSKGTGLCLDIGCGSSRILGGLGNGVGLDIQMPKLRFAKRYNKPLVQGSAWALPFHDNTFDRIVCSQVIEHLVAGEGPFLEMSRILKEGGTLVIGTPDYGKRLWRLIERVYKLVVSNGYADEHITRYTWKNLTRLLKSKGFLLQSTMYVMASEMVLRFIKSVNHS